MGSYTCPMNASENLIPNDIKAKCRESKKILESNIDDLNAAKACLEKFVRNDVIEGQSVDALKQHIDSYSTIISCMNSCFNLDIQDLVLLIVLVGDEELKGSVINPKATSYFDKLEDAKEKRDFYSSLVDSWNPFFGVCPYLASLGFYEMQVHYYQSKFDKWDGKARKYVEKNNATAELLTKNTDLRNSIANALNNIASEWVNGKVEYNPAAPWRSALDEVCNDILEAEKKKFYKEAGGKTEYDWDAIDAFLHKNSDDVTDIEAIAMAQILAEMSTSDLNTLFNHATYKDEKNSSFVLTVYENSSSLGVAIDYCLAMAEMKCEMTIFNSDVSGSLSHDMSVDVKNDLTKAVMMSILYDRMTSVGAGENHYITIKEELENGYIVYKVEDVPANLTTDTTLGDAFTTTVDTREFIINCWVDGAALDRETDGLSALIVKKYTTGPSQFGVEKMADIVAGEVFGKLADYIPGIDKMFTAESLAVDAVKTYEQNIDINASVNINELSNILQSMQVGCMFSFSDGLLANQVIVSEAKYDANKIAVDVELYNQYLKSIGQSGNYTSQDLINSISNGGDISLAEDYYDWYASNDSNNGEKQIDQYWRDVESALKIYNREHPGSEYNSINQLNYEQVKTLHEMSESGDYSGSL